jgi:ABC-type arginine transport system ATPase subunit
MLKRLAFEAESDMFAIKLSGGQMRKLCVAVALINSPKVCLNVLFYLGVAINSLMRV